MTAGSQSGARLTSVLAGLTAGTVVVTALSLMMGSRYVPVADLLAVLSGGGSPEAKAVINDFRLPRTLSGLAGGSALAVAGVIMQAHTRNRLADPGLMGVSAGAAVAVVAAMSFFGASTPLGYVGFAVVGAALGLVSALAIGFAASRRVDSSPATLILAGAAVSAFLSAITGILLLLDSAALERYRFWTVGSLAAVRGFDVLAIASPMIVVGLILALLHSRSLDVLALGEALASALGRSIALTRIAGLAVVTLLVGGAIACCGSLAFVGLVVPNALRLLGVTAHRWLIGLAALGGGTLTLAADILGRFLVHPGELAVGVVLSIVGGPLFIALVVRQARGGVRL
ncbi:iron chelate uptake ABC transporter family permease subunit [soil metagenome]